MAVGRGRRKKKWKRKLTKEQSLKLAPFSNLSSLDSDPIGDIQEISRAVGTSFDINRKVPTLSQLCLRVNSLHQKNKPLSDIPAPGVQKLVKVYNQNESIGSLQLAWLQKILQMYSDYGEGLRQRNSWHHEWLLFTRSGEADRQRVIRIPMGRPVWTDRAVNLNWERDPEYSTTLIPLTDIRFLSAKDDHCFNSTQTISVLADMIDRMIPPMLTLSTQPLTSSGDDDLEEKAIATSVWRVRHLLYTRYPNLVRHFFDEALPYAWWKRGNIRLAEKFFLQIISKTDTFDDWDTDWVQTYYMHHCTERSNILRMLEIARMFNMAGEIQTKIYDKAFEMCCSQAFLKTGRHLNDVQFKTLAAASLDTGLMTNVKRGLALHAWQEALASPEALNYMAVSLASFTSTMTLHLAGIQENNDKTHVNKSKHVRKLEATTQHPMVDLGVALLHALSGEAEDSRRAHRKWISRSGRHFPDISPGEQFNSNAITADADLYNPWQPIVNQVKSEEETIPLLRVVWRTQLGQPYLPPDPSRGFGTCSLGDHCILDDLKFRLTSDGYITGDFEMLLPPVHSPKLDPYTGKLQPGSQEDIPNVWYHLSPDAPVGTLLPRVTRVYENTKKNIAVDLTQSIVRVSDGDLRSACHRCVLEWNCRTGQQARVDLRKVIKAEKRKMVEKAVCSNSQTHAIDGNQYQFSKRWKSDMLDMLEEYFTKGFDFSYKVMDEELVEANKAPEQNKNGGQVPNTPKMNTVKLSKNAQKRQQKLAKKPKAKTQFEMEVVNTYYFSETVVLAIRLSALWDAILVFVDCSTAESFKMVTVQIVDDLKDKMTSWSRVEETFGHGPTSSQILQSVRNPGSDAEVSMMFECTNNSHSKKLHHLRTCIFGDKGELLLEYTREAKTTRERRNQPVSYFSRIIGRNMYGIHPSRKRLICCEITHSICSEKFEVEEIRSIDTCYRYILILTSDGISICDSKMKVVPWSQSDPDDVTKLQERSGITFLTGPKNTLSRVLFAQKFDQPLSALTTPVIRALISLDNQIILLELPTEDRCSSSCAHVVRIIELPGWITGATPINHHMGFIATASLHSQGDPIYFESIYHITYDGVIRGIVPFITGKKRHMKAVYLPVNCELATNHKDLPFSTDGWYMIFYDGLGGICSAKLDYE